jgi:hypothetical protein
MTLCYRVWVRSDERVWWIDARLVVVLVVAKLLGIHTSDEDEGIELASSGGEK